MFFELISSLDVWIWAFLVMPFTGFIIFANRKRLFGLLVANLHAKYGNSTGNRNQKLIGSTFILEMSLESGRGMVKVGDKLLTVEGSQCIEVGSLVKVVSSKDKILYIQEVTN